jgi:hypothetical protein
VRSRSSDGVGFFYTLTFCALSENSSKVSKTMILLLFSITRQEVVRNLLLTFDRCSLKKALVRQSTMFGSRGKLTIASSSPKATLISNPLKENYNVNALPSRKIDDDLPDDLPDDAVTQRWGERDHKRSNYPDCTACIRGGRCNGRRLADGLLPRTYRVSVARCACGRSYCTYHGYQRNRYNTRDNWCRNAS